MAFGAATIVTSREVLPPSTVDGARNIQLDRDAHHTLPAFTASLNGLPGLNVGAVEAAMFRLSPERCTTCPRFRVLAGAFLRRRSESRAATE